MIGVVVLSPESNDPSEELYWESVYRSGGVGKHEKENLAMWFGRISNLIAADVIQSWSERLMIATAFPSL